MTEVHHDAPTADGIARAAQMAAMSITVLEALARLRAQRIAERAMDDERIASAARAQRLVDHASARVAWTPAHDDDWLRRASAGELARAWAAATPWGDTDFDAQQAAQRVEQRLHTMHPDAMAAYHQARADGADPAQAMREAAPLFANRQAIEAPEHEPPTPHLSSGHPRQPRDIAADGYPFPTKDAITAGHQQRSTPHVITTLPQRSRQAASR